MSFRSFPHHEVTDLMRRRNLTSIPKDQQNLLEASDSWAVDLKQQRHDPAHVPGHVLESVKAAYIAREESSKKITKSTRPDSPESSTSSSPRQNGHFARSAAQSQIPPSSSPERAISWGSSPPRDESFRHQAAVEAQIIRETPKAAPKSAFKKTPASAPMAPPPLPSSATRPLVNIEYPSSGPEEDLEMELPQAQARPDAPINRVASRLQATVASPTSSGRKPTDTPPCAQGTQLTQPVIPNTEVKESTKQEEPAPENRRKRRMKELHFSDASPKKIRQTMNRLAPTKDFTQIISSNSTSSSSVIPATNPTQASVINSIEDGKTKRLENAAQEEDNMQVVLSQPQQQPSRPTPKPTPSSQEYLPATPRLDLSQYLMDNDAKPFEVFKMVYPDFTELWSGTFWDFIKGCVCLDYYRRDKLLRESLYDDFIREFAHGYQTYAKAARNGQRPLPAIQWYNNLQGRPKYNSMILTRENIGYVLDVYPKDVIQAIQATQVMEEKDAAEALGHHLEEQPAPSLFLSVMNQKRPTPPPFLGARKSISAYAPGIPSESISTPAPVAQSRVLSPMVQAPLALSPLRGRTGSMAPPSSTKDRTNAMVPSTMIRSRAGSIAPSISSKRRASSVAPSPINRRITIPSTASSVAGSSGSRRAPRPSQYLESLASGARDKSVSRRRSMEERSRFIEHCKQRNGTSRASSRAL